MVPSQIPGVDEKYVALKLKGQHAALYARKYKPREDAVALMTCKSRSITASVAHGAVFACIADDLGRDSKL
jgi:hypothetical protein